MGKKPTNEGPKPGSNNFGYKPGGSEQNGYQPSQTTKPVNPPGGGSSVNPPKK